jgi:conjugal transfer pilus assembly protein TraV
MKTLKQVTFLSVLSLLVMACSTVGSEFSCNKTAGDSCLTIEQVDSMTRYADSPILTRRPSSKRVSQKKEIKTRSFYVSEKAGDAGIWINKKARG